jgi:hypothetical protein
MFFEIFSVCFEKVQYVSVVSIPFWNTETNWKKCFLVSWNKPKNNRIRLSFGWNRKKIWLFRGHPSPQSCPYPNLGARPTIPTNLAILPGCTSIYFTVWGKINNVCETPFNITVNKLPLIRIPGSWQSPKNSIILMSARFNRGQHQALTIRT